MVYIETYVLLYWNYADVDINTEKCAADLMKCTPVTELSVQGQNLQQQK